MAGKIMIDDLESVSEFDQEEYDMMEVQANQLRNQRKLMDQHVSLNSDNSMYDEIDKFDFRPAEYRSRQREMN